MPTDHLPATVAVAVSRRVLPWKKKQRKKVRMSEQKSWREINKYMLMSVLL